MNDMMIIPAMQSQEELIIDLTCKNLTSSIILFLFLVGLMWVFEPLVIKKINNSKLKYSLKFWLSFMYKPVGLLILSLIIAFISFI